MSAKKKAIDPVTLAREAVTELFDNLMTSTLALEPGTGLQPDLLAVFEQLEEAQYQEHKASTDDAFAWRLAGREAGFLVGMQIGLRLRRLSD